MLRPLLLPLFLAVACAHGAPQGAPDKEGGSDAAEVAWNNPGGSPRAAAEAKPRAANTEAPSGPRAARQGAATPRPTHDHLRERVVGAARRYDDALHDVSKQLQAIG